MIPRRLIVLVFVAFAVMAAFWLVAAFCPAPYEYAEGDTATWAWLWRHGESIYKAGAQVSTQAASGLPMRRTNYPPLYLFALARLAPSDGAILLTGRLLAIVGYLLAMAMAGLSAARATGSNKTGLLCAALLGGTFRAAFWGGVCRADAMALGIGACGVTLAALGVRGWPLWSALCFSISVLCKQNFIVFPAGVFLWAMTDSRARPRAIAMAAIAALLVGGVVWRNHLLGPLVLDSMARWLPANFLRHLVTSVAPSMFGIALAITLWRRRRSLSEETRRTLGPWFGVLAVGLVWTLSLGRTGADFNYLMELLTAVSVLSVVAASTALHPRLFAAHAAVSLVETVAWVAAYSIWVLPNKGAEMALAKSALAGVHGDVLSEQTWYATGNGHAPVVIPFLSAQLAAGGRWDAAPLVEEAKAGQIERVLLGFPLEGNGAEGTLWHSERFPPALLEALRSRYELTGQAGELFVYAPRGAAP